MGRGVIYRCPVCGAEIGVIAYRTGHFRPRCCNKDMLPQNRRLAFYFCPVCGAEVAIVRGDRAHFRPRCCNTDMKLEAA